ncbi:glycosyltransferase involved in cell wall biosynthesis [Acetoanaerobium pronyense]|uniref:Glycosyltransferase involved in cell wall biosynthesis n=1 Tax=Acetoanaerobium pronyense TaxID=1482736 RepID=A0ABS4KMC4_9FIRM|nr:glycosyltransferase family 2 protein [Acetoanaerobium pronyense]MBP2027784.1 glycosyltransferase involved in cell wall biosynthesis [Acetoanaerobium pronyense]
MEYMLSICMMVKNEELHLERCLESLKPILERNDVELIIVDTGSEDKTVEIAKKYTGKVYFKKWFNDFSGMRNVTISYAKGEWIFILDADEALENIMKLIEFLENTNKYQANTLFIKAKNYSNIKNLDSYSIMTTPRIFRNDGEFRYEGIVHNQPIFKKPVEYLDVIIGHYGYIIMDKEIMDRKFERTKALLIKELDKNPENIYYLFQLSTSYNMYGDIEEAYIVSKKAYNLLMKSKKEIQFRDFSIFSVHLLNCLSLKKYDEVIAAALKAISIRKDYIDAYFYMIYANQGLGDLESVKKYSEKYLSLVKRFDELPISRDDSIAIYSNDKATIKKIRFFLAKYYINKNSYEIALKHLEEIGLDNTNKRLYIIIFLKLEKIQELRKLYDDIEEDSLKINLIELIEEEIKKLDKDKKNKIRELFSDVEEDYSIYCKYELLGENQFEEKMKLANQMYRGMDYLKPNIYYGEIFSFICENKKLELNLFNKYNKTSIFYYINHFYNVKYNELYLKVFEWVKNIEFEKLSLKNEFTLKNILETLVLRLSSEFKNTGIDKKIEENIDIFHKYLEVGLKLVPKMYFTEGISIKYDYIADQESKFMVLMYLYNENLNKENFKSAFKYYKLAAEAYPEMADFLSRYLEIE